MVRTMKVRIMTTLMVALCLSMPALAEVVAVQVDGSGLTKESAIEQALVQAIRQVNGTHINSQQSIASAQARINGESDIRIEIAKGTDIKAKGQIVGYDILDSQCLEGDCSVTLNVKVHRKKVHKYKVPGLATDKRRRIAVLPFTGGREFRKMVTRQIQEQLVQSRRFAVLDRKHEREYRAEKSLWQSNDVPVAEKARLGKVLGLDYIVLGSIEKAGVRRWTTNIELTGEKYNHVRTSATVSYQVIAVATRQIKWSDTVSVTLNNVGSLERAAAATARKLSKELLDNIFPLRVVQSGNGQVILNQGGKTIQHGSYFDIFALGEVIVDPYTNEPLGQQETKVATVKVIRVEAKMTYGKVVEGDSSAIQKGFIARARRSVAQPARQKPAKLAPKREVIVPKAGGVIL